MQETSDSIVIAVSDPTQLCTDPITVKLYTDASTTVLSQSPEIQITSLSDPIVLKVNVNGTRGKTHQIVLFKNTTATAITPDMEVFGSTVRVVDGKTLCSACVPQSGKLSVTMTDLTGRIITYKEINLIPGTNDFEILPRNNLRGIYLILLDMNGERKTHKIIYN